MIFLHLGAVLLSSILFLTTVQGVLNKNQELKRREAPADSYGPPPRPNLGLPIPIYGAPGPVGKYPPPPPDVPPAPQHPHKEYGVPNFKYGPPKLNNLEYHGPFKNLPPKPDLFGNGIFGSGSNNLFSSGSKGSFHEQIKTHFGVPRPSYGPPIYNQRPHSLPLKPVYGPPPQQGYGPPPQQSYGPPPPQNYGPPPQQNYGPPPKPLLQLPSPSYGPPQSVIAHPLPARGPAPIYGPPTQPKPGYGPPTSALRPVYGAPQGNGLGESSSGLQGSLQSLPVKQLTILETTNHAHHGNQQTQTVSCDGWKPIPGPVGHDFGGTGSGFGLNSIDNNIHQQNNVQHVSGGLTDEQLVAIALNTGSLNPPQQHLQLPVGPSGPAGSSGISGSFEHFQNSYDIKDDNNLNPQALELTQSAGHGGDSYSSPPRDSYAPGSVHDFKYNAPSIGLVPPSGVYGVPPGGSYRNQIVQQQSAHSSSGLAIQYGTVSGNLKPWPQKGLPPRKPVSFRPPVPEGLLESIGASVQHLDTFGIKSQHQAPTYIPPPAAEIPQHNSLPHEHQVNTFASEQNIYYQALPGGQTPRFNQAQDCGNGPNLNVGGSIGVGSNQFNSFDFNANQISNYNQNQQSGALSSEYFDGAAQGFGQGTVRQNIPADSYGPPPSGIPSDSVGYESKNSAVISEGFALNHLQQQQQQQQQQQDSSSISTSNSEHLPGLPTSLNVVSAQKSQSLTIPVQGQLGTYQLQFQSANDGTTNHLSPEEQANHQQILSEGLLQSILTAIEQPSGNVAPQFNAESGVDHKHVDDFLNSPEGQKALAEPSDTIKKP